MRTAGTDPNRSVARTDFQLPEGVVVHMEWDRWPHRLRIGLACLVLLSAAVAVARGDAADLPDGFTDTRIVGSLDQPIGLARVPDSGTNPVRILFIEQRTARVRMEIAGAVTTLGTVPNVNSTASERGLLGIAIDPSFPTRPFIYVHTTSTSGKVVISRFTLSGDLSYTGAGAMTMDPASRYDLLNNLPDNASNHNGGTVRFAPDGMLYVSIGDDATSCNAQQTGVGAGKILRLDVSRVPAGPGGPAPYALLTAAGNPYATSPDSIARLDWVLGLRNPFRFHVDAGTGDLFVADVGEGDWEELTRFSAGGQNGGWPWREGPNSFSSCSGSQPSQVAPIAYYSHSDGVAIMSGGVYRRPSFGADRFPAEYDGNAFFLDYYSGMMRRLTGSGSSWSIAPQVPGQSSMSNWASGMENVTDVLHLPDGSLLYVRQNVGGGSVTGEIRRIAYPVTVGVEPGAGSALWLALPRPTPSRGSVSLDWTQPRSEAVRLSVYDASGRWIRTLIDGAVLEAGSHQSEWDGTMDGRRVQPGIYFARLDVGGDTRRVRIMMLR